MDTTKIDELRTQLQSISCYNATQPIPFNVVLNIREGIASVAQQISEINPPISSHLIDLKKGLFTEDLTKLSANTSYGCLCYPI